MTAAGRLTVWGLREALLDGPAGADRAGVALVDLLAEAGLLDLPAFTDWCVYVDDDGYTDLDLAQVSASLWPGAAGLTETQRRMVGAGVCLVDLAAELRELPGATGLLVLETAGVAAGAGVVSVAAAVAGGAR